MSSAPNRTTTVQATWPHVRKQRLGVPEATATGSAAGCLAAYLLEHGYLGTGSVDVRVEQSLIGRPLAPVLAGHRMETR